QNLFIDFVIHYSYNPDNAISELHDKNEIFECESKLKYLTYLLYNLDLDFILKSISQISEVRISKGIFFFYHRYMEFYKTPIPKLKFGLDSDIEMVISKYMEEITDRNIRTNAHLDLYENLREELENDIPK